jgi:tetratricopeptide (TPR) repeat protein
MQLQARYRPGDTIGDYYHVYQVFMGGMGEVYLCLSLDNDSPIALKTFQARYLTNPKLREAFKKEVATWVALEKHPNIVRCFQMEVFDNQPFMDLEWVASDENWGTDLRGWLRWGIRDQRTIMDFAIDICRGLIHASQKQPGIVHRDLKPENILVAQGRVAKITDFGLAKIVQESNLGIPQIGGASGSETGLLEVSGIVGTPPYMAPEQWLGEPLDVRTDIYALGCILFEMLTGSRPYTATSLEGLRQQHLLTRAPRLPDKDLPAALDNLLAKCLSKQKRERIASVEELLQELTQIYQAQFSQAPRALSTSSEFTASDYNNRGNTYNKLQRYEQAIPDLTRAIELDPDVALAYNNRSISYYRLVRYEESLVDSNQAIQLDPEYVGGYVSRANTYFFLERYGEALSNFTRAIQLDPGSEAAVIHTNRGNVYFLLNRYEEALADLTRAIELDPDLAEAYGNRGLVYDELQRYIEALVDFTRAIALDPDSPDFYTNRAHTYEKLQRYEEALTDFTHVLEFDSIREETYINRGNTYTVLERFFVALADFTSALQLDPSSAQINYNRGNTYKALQRYDNAVADYTCAIELDPTDTLIYIKFGILFQRQGAWQEAVRYFEQAAQLGNPEGVEFATETREMFADESASADYLGQRAFEAFQSADSPDYMQRAVAQFPFMTEAGFIANVERTMEQGPQDLTLTLEPRLAYLRQRE